MTATICRVALAAGLTLGLASSAMAQMKSIPSPADDNPNQINVSCYRGPLKTVAWDRPNAVFIEDLVQLGYSFQEAHAIGERVCRDEYGVGNGDHKIATLMKLLKENPPR
ncbi:MULTISPECIES: hypothetical protein [Tropicimonas]|uniref:Uncharacterized protein n=2 Tax=Tropicimonas TaxID=599652 RepID=A0A239CSH4_9RHOB|nr:hypothetical protein [Tropicimonas sediminicola]SNS22611.1 hypothetical protein SAMN05421757_101430 [Tropicimonas sediminicola]